MGEPDHDLDLDDELDDELDGDLLAEYVEQVTDTGLREAPVVRGRSVGIAAGGDWLFRGLDLVIPAGGVVALIGPNGVGKSTLLRCLYGLSRPAEGKLTVCGQEPDERSVEFRRLVSVLLDDSALFDELSPRQHLDLMLRSLCVQ